MYLAVAHNLYRRADINGGRNRKMRLRKIFRKRLTDLNDQLCYFLLLERELNRNLEVLEPSSKANYTTEVFADNIYAKKLHVYLENLPDFQAKYRISTFGSYFSLSYEVVKEYYNEALTLLEKFGKRALVKRDRNKDEPPEEYYFRILKEFGYALPDEEIKQTLTYLRLRRNHFVHLGQTVDSDFRSHIGTQGAKLNHYWKDALKSLDFKSTAVAEFHEGEIIELIKIIRVLFEELDDGVINSLSSKKVLKHLIQEKIHLKSTEISRNVADKYVRKIRAAAQLEYGLRCTEEDAMKVLEGMFHVLSK